MVPSFQASYHKAIQSFQRFTADTLNNPQFLPASSADVLIHIAHLYQVGYALSSIHSILSIISYYHRLYQFPDPTHSFLVKKMLTGISKSLPLSDLRTHITLPILKLLVQSVQHISTSPYHASLIQVMYLLALHAFLHVGEFTLASTSHNNPNLIQYHQMSVLQKDLLLTCWSFKHHRGTPITLFSIQAREPLRSPVLHLSSYTTLRGSAPGPLFQSSDGTPISRSFFQYHLHLNLAWANIPSRSIQSHSFRIGAAMSATASSHYDEAIKKMGRWRSSAFRYIRIPSLSLLH
jgi:hypothetical protein